MASAVGVRNTLSIDDHTAAGFAGPHRAELDGKLQYRVAQPTVRNL